MNSVKLIPLSFEGSITGIGRDSKDKYAEFILIFQLLRNAETSTEFRDPTKNSSDKR